jgi:hypothetical protein
MIALLLLLLLQDVAVVKDGDVELLRYQLVKPADSKVAADSACYFHPLATPKGVVITDVAPADHKHHRGVFFAWLQVEGSKKADFWGWGQHAPIKDRKIVNREQRVQGRTMTVTNEWTAEGTVLLRENLSATAKDQGDLRVVDLGYYLTPSEDLTIAQWAFSGFCVRTRKDGKIAVVGPEGEVKLPDPKHTDPKSDWPDAKWYGFQFTLPDGKEAGVAVFSAPSNPPTLWHVVKGIGMINPAVCAPAPLQLKKDQATVLRYRVILWDGPTPREALAKLGL